MYDGELPEIYDMIYRSRGKDYAEETASVARLVREARPDARSLLDMACGTGPHLAHFAELFEHVEGVELSEDMLALAKRRLPDVPLTKGDMRDFDLGRTFDAVTCMFSSIAHMADAGELDVAVSRLAHHLVPGGVLVIEPWWFPERFASGYVASDSASEDGRTVVRVSHSRVEGRMTRMEVHYLVAEAEEGIRHFTDTLFMTLFTREEYEHALRKAGCAPTYIEGGPSGRGLFLGVRD
ncbi:MULTISPECIES: class I SAM-dependent methyltransferase [unclassified Streptosporangium]|uniref:class I SAM-dependent methyltransferase n=1 Tax=unclassified Streptosporangium TaxID=2632669 RepID=UPI002E2D674F|nr:MULTISPECIES: class I SAM-dependent methyltransferase [unclassified Streptosporangium]